MPSRPQQYSRRDNLSYLNHDTIAAYSSALGGPVGVVRVSGAEASRLLAELTSDPSILECKVRTLLRRTLRDGQGGILDDALVTRYEAPASFTGEDGFEAFVHGSAPVVESVLLRLTELGARLALPGEFSFRAVKNGKLTLTAAEAIADLIQAQNPGAARLALEKMSGAQQGQLRGLAEELRTLAALSELGIDFSDQDVDEVSRATLGRRAEQVRSALRQLRDSIARGVRLQEGVGISLLGAPNSGKSSLFNALLAEERSIVSPIAGTTRDVVRETFNLPLRHGGTITLRLEDTAGVRDTEDAIEAEGVSRAIQSAGRADLVVWVLDATVVQHSTDSLLPSSGILPPEKGWIGVLSKVDLLSEATLKEVMTKVSSMAGAGGFPWFPVSSVTGRGVSDFVAALATRAESLVQRDPGEVLLTRHSHAACCAEAEEHLSRALNAPELDLFASDLRHALMALEPMIGTTTPDDLLTRIFSEFCIGK